MSETTQTTLCKNEEVFRPLTESPAHASDSESTSSDRSETNADVMRLVQSTRTLLRTSSNEAGINQKIPFIRFGSREQLWHPKTFLHERHSNPVEMDRIPQPARSSVDGSLLHYTEGKPSIPQKPVSLQNLSLSSPQSPLPGPIWDVGSDLVFCAPARTSSSEQNPSMTTSNLSKSHSSNEPLKIELQQNTSSTVGYTEPHTPNEKLSTTTQSAFFTQPIPDVLCSDSTRFYGSASVSGSMKRTKIGLPFFRPKQTSPTQGKSVQMKELKRMIRAGKPSYEQIHSWGHSFETLLNDRFGLALFKDFLSTEFSDENIEFWIACQEYKQITNPKKLAARAQRIFAEFIAVQANREVNLDSKTRLQTEADLANPTVHTLDNAQKRIQALMEKDSYRRFLRSEVYMTLYTEAREVAKAAAATALAASLQQASNELDGAVLHLVNTASSNSPFSFLSNLGSGFTSSPGPGLHLPGVAAAAATAEAGMNSVQDLQLLGLSTSRHMRYMQANASGAARTNIRPKTESAETIKIPNPTSGGGTSSPSVVRSPTETNTGFSLNTTSEPQLKTTPK